MDINILTHRKTCSDELATSMIQTAIDKAHENGGGRVIVPPGTWRCTTIFLKSGVDLHLQAGATILGHDDPAAFPRLPFYGREPEPILGMHLIHASGQKNISITGSGTIDANGAVYYEDLQGKLAWPLRHSEQDAYRTTIEFYDCEDVRVEDILITNVCNWNLHCNECTRVWVRGIRIINPPDAPNADGIDLSGCHDVMISDCFIDTCDDAICLKTFANGRTCEAVTVTNCVIRTHCAALKLGSTESAQDMRNITFSNCVIRGSQRGVGIYSQDGGVIENIAVSNLVIETRVPLMFSRPIHIELSRLKARDPSAASQHNDDVGKIRNVSFSNIVCQTEGRIMLTAIEGSQLENITLRDIQMNMPTVDDPAIHGATVGGWQFAKSNPWARVEQAALVAENVTGLVVDGFRIQWPEGPTPQEWLFDAKLANGTQELFTPKIGNVSHQLNLQLVR